MFGCPKKFRLISRLRFVRNLSSRRSGRCHSRKNDNNEDEEENGIRTENYRVPTDFYLHKSRGQHLLTNPRVLDTIVRKSAIRPTDTVLEIGPGTGNLTLKLLEAAEKVVAVEMDERMVEVLQKRVSEHGFENRIHIIRKDALRTEFPHFELVVANIPYGISSPLVVKLVYGSNPYRSATLLLQKEFARRLLANSGDSEFNRLAVNVKLVAEVEFVMDVSRRDFFPCPKVDSSVVIIRPKAEIPDVDLKEWWAFTRTCFSKKNKTLGATFKRKRKVMELLKLANESSITEGTLANFNTDDCSVDEDGESEDEKECESCCSESDSAISLLKGKVIGILKSGGFENKRPSKLSVEELLRLLLLFNRAGIFFHGHEKQNIERNADAHAAAAAAYAS